MQMRKDFDKNILVISDLHLGEDLRPGGANVSYLRHLVKLEQELEAFLAHYTSHRLDGQPWKLDRQRRHGRFHVGHDPARRREGRRGRRGGPAVRPRLRRAPVAEEDGEGHRPPPGRVPQARRVRGGGQRPRHRRRQPRRRVPLPVGAAHAGRVAVRPVARRRRRRRPARRVRAAHRVLPVVLLQTRTSSTSSTGTSTTSTARSTISCTRSPRIARRSAPPATRGRSTASRASRCRSRTPACATSPTRSTATTRTPPSTGALATT